MTLKKWRNYSEGEQICICQGLGLWWSCDHEGAAKGNFGGVSELFCILIVVVVAQFSAFVKIHKTVPHYQVYLLLIIKNKL